VNGRDWPSRVRRLLARPPDRAPSDDGRALIEVVVLAVLLLIPTVYLLSAFLRVQSATFAVAQAARDAGRLLDNAPTLAAGLEQAELAAAVALDDQNVPTDGLSIAFVAAGAGCDAAPITPSLAPGAIFDICVSSVITLPGVPSVVTGPRNTVTGVFTLHVGEFREAR